MERNVIGKNTKITGEIVSDGDFRIDGHLEGQLHTKGKVIIGADGLVTGTVEAQNADFEGSFDGKLKISKTLSLKASAVISGEVLIGRLSVEPGATFNASCQMIAEKKEVIQIDEKKAKPTEEEPPKKAKRFFK